MCLSRTVKTDGKEIKLDWKRGSAIVLNQTWTRPPSVDLLGGSATQTPILKHLDRLWRLHVGSMAALQDLP